MKYQVLGHRRRLQKGDRPYDVICEFDNLEQLYFMIERVDKQIYDSALVVDTYTNRLVANREFGEPLVKNLHKRK